MKVLKQIKKGREEQQMSTRHFLILTMTEDVPVLMKIKILN